MVLQKIHPFVHGPLVVVNKTATPMTCEGLEDSNTESKHLLFSFLIYNYTARYTMIKSAMPKKGECWYRQTCSVHCK